MDITVSDYSVCSFLPSCGKPDHLQRCPWIDITITAPAVIVCAVAKAAKENQVQVVTGCVRG